MTGSGAFTVAQTCTGTSLDDPDGGVGGETAGASVTNFASHINNINNLKLKLTEKFHHYNNSNSCWQNVKMRSFNRNLGLKRC